VSSGGRGTHVQSKSDLLTSTGVRGDLVDGLTLCQSHSSRLPREKVIIPQLRGA